MVVCRQHAIPFGQQRIDLLLIACLYRTIYLGLPPLRLLFACRVILREPAGAIAQRWHWSDVLRNTLIKKALLVVGGKPVFGSNDVRLLCRRWLIEIRGAGCVCLNLRPHIGEACAGCRFGGRGVEVRIGWRVRLN